MIDQSMGPGRVNAEPVGPVKHVSRREVLRLAGGSTAALTLGGVLAACGGSSSSSTATSSAQLGPLKVEAGTDIPSATVRYGLLPYGDNSLPVIGMLKGWFKEVGINIQPQPVGSKVADNAVVPKLVNNEIDIVNWDGPTIIQSMVSAPQLRMFGFTDTSLAQRILAPPGSNLSTVSQLVKNGTPFPQAMKQVMKQLVGKRVGLSDSAYHSVFYSTVFQLGGVNPTQMKITPIEDSKMVQLGKAGQLDFASPAGAAQQVELIALGWIDVVSVNDLLAGLPPGDPRAVSTLDHVGPACNLSYYEKNRETVLRVMSVNFRLVDNVINDPNQTLPTQLPYLESVTGGSYTLHEVKLIDTLISEMVPFEKQTKYWTDTKAPEYYRNVYNPQIKALQKGGVLPKSQHLDATQCFNGTEVYTTMVGLKHRYEELAAGAARKSPQLAAKAKVQAQNRNYLDAVRFALAASKA